ncbi:MAG: hypothetical protein K0U38_07505 [Epsilonproteobacteria bacterium]|nr:hypothetical protein [Campylobacterota bacterium]
MKIVSDNPELLEEIYNQLKLEGIVVKPEKEPSKKTDMSGELEMVRLILEGVGAFYSVTTVIQDVTALVKGEHIYIEKKDGDKIAFSEYKKMSKEALSEIF